MLRLTYRLECIQKVCYRSVSPSFLPVIGVAKFPQDREKTPVNARRPMPVPVG
jgi:hypothetical protein